LAPAEERLNPRYRCTYDATHGDPHCCRW
jgi:hypothetical protein